MACLTLRSHTLFTNETIWNNHGPGKFTMVFCGRYAYNDMVHFGETTGVYNRKYGLNPRGKFLVDFEMNMSGEFIIGGYLRFTVDVVTQRSEEGSRILYSSDYIFHRCTSAYDTTGFGRLMYERNDTTRVVVLGKLERDGIRQRKKLINDHTPGNNGYRMRCTNDIELAFFLQFLRCPSVGNGDVHSPICHGSPIVRSSEIDHFVMYRATGIKEGFSYQYNGMCEVNMESRWHSNRFGIGMFHEHCYAEKLFTDYDWADEIEYQIENGKTSIALDIQNYLSSLKMMDSSKVP